MRALQFAVLVAGLLPWVATAQGGVAVPTKTRAGTVSLDADLDHLSAAADTLHKKLPSFQCREIVASKDLKPNGDLRYRTELQADLRVQRLPDGTVIEQYSIATMNGEPYTGARTYLPIYVEGGFRMATTYFESRFRPCFRYSIGPGRLDFQAETLGKPDCYDMEGVVGFATLDNAGEMTHLERHIEEDIAVRHNRVPFAAIDLQPVDLDGHVYRLSSHMVAETYAKDVTRRFEANYVNCRLFQATVTIKSEGSKAVAPE